MDTDLIESGRKHDVRGRRIESVAERDRLLTAYDASGLTQIAFAQREGLVYSTFVSWLKQRRQGRQLPRAEASEGRALFQEVAIAPPPPAQLEVCLPDGTVLRGGSAAELAALARALRC